MFYIDVPYPSTSLPIDEFLPTSTKQYYGRDIKDLFYGDIPKVTPRPRDPREIQNASNSARLFKPNLLSVPPLTPGRSKVIKSLKVYSLYNWGML